MSCVVYGCFNGNPRTADPSTMYFRFPKEPSIAQQWLRACLSEDNDLDINEAKICSLHFDEDSYIYEIRIIDNRTCLVKMLKHDAFPILQMPKTIQVVSKNENEEIIVLTIPTKQIENAAEEEIQLQVEAPEETRDNEPETQNNEEKYKTIQTTEGLNAILTQNDKLELQLKVLEKDLRHSRKLLLQAMEEYREKNAELLHCSKMLDRTAEEKAATKPAHAFSNMEEIDLLSKVFSLSQIKILAGKQKTVWTNDDMAVAYTIRHLSSRRFYKYLNQKIRIPLPALSSIERWRLLTSRRRKMLMNKSQENPEKVE